MKLFGFTLAAVALAQNDTFVPAAAAEAARSFGVELTGSTCFKCEDFNEFFDDKFKIDQVIASIKNKISIEVDDTNKNVSKERSEISRKKDTIDRLKKGVEVLIAERDAEKARAEYFETNKDLNSSLKNIASLLRVQNKVKLFVAYKLKIQSIKEKLLSLKKQNCYLMQYVTKSCLLAVFASKDTTKWITLNLLLQYVDTNLENLALRRALSRRKIVQTAIKLSKKRIFSSLMTRFCNKKLSGLIFTGNYPLQLFDLILLLHKLSLLSQITFPHTVHCNILALDENFYNYQ
ncbi:unnamed protein product [Oikopleura dioica]|uniref:Uncharacterized protein n=1 Tax=Oikopleura dioica TaxID=34765 RepID=E4YRJ8_OIKDI|nr:unnamed protein product [Oikopleura dioica]